jgi:SAM-dependent methyltransferase
MNTLNYWENRYKNNGNSGAGSYGRLAEFKADVINNFIAENKITSVIEFGCGDGNQLSLFEILFYIGYDVSQSVIAKLQEKFNADMNKLFYHISNYNSGVKSELTLSLDVIYHLLEEDVFSDYMQKLFDTSSKYVIIYSCNRNDIVSDQHIRFRVFLKWALENVPEFKLIKLIENKYPYDKADPNNTSWSDFYFFERTN